MTHTLRNPPPLIARTVTSVSVVVRRVKPVLECTIKCGVCWLRVVHPCTLHGVPASCPHSEQTALSFVTISLLATSSVTLANGWQPKGHVPFDEDRMAWVGMPPQQPDRGTPYFSLHHPHHARKNATAHTRTSRWNVASSPATITILPAFAAASQKGTNCEASHGATAGVRCESCTCRAHHFLTAGTGAPDAHLRKSAPHRFQSHE